MAFDLVQSFRNRLAQLPHVTVYEYIPESAAVVEGCFPADLDETQSDNFENGWFYFYADKTASCGIGENVDREGNIIPITTLCKGTWEEVIDAISYYVYSNL